MNTPVNPKAQMGSIRKYQMDLARYYRIPAVQSSLSIVLSLFVVSFFIFFALRPTFLTVVELQKKIKTSEATLTQIKTKVEALQTAERLYEKISAELPMVETNIPSVSAGYQSLASSIEVLAQQNGVTLHSLAIGETLLYSKILSPFTPNKKQEVMAMSFNARVTGSYVGVMGFLRGILEMDRLIGTSSITLAKELVTETDTTASASLTVVGEVYYVADRLQLQRALPLKKGNQ